LGKVSTFFRLNREEKRIFFHAVSLLIRSRIALRRKPFKILVERLASLNPCTRLQIFPPISISAYKLMRLFAAACRSVPFTTCLSRAMAGQQFLLAYGHVPVLHIGVVKEDKQNLKAHAWLTLEEHVILGRIPDLSRYRELPPLAAGKVKKL
jgi:hypothetical protein